jgi:hypothetical protein
MALEVLDEQSLRPFDRDACHTGERGDQRHQDGQAVDGVSDLAAEQLSAVVIEDADVMEASAPVDPAPETRP